MIDVFLGPLESAFAWMVEASWQASVLAALVLLLQWALRGRLNPRWHHALWLLVIARLILPVMPESALSLFQFAPAPPPAVEQSMTEPIFSAAPLMPEVALAPTPAPLPTPYPFSAFTILALVWLAGALGLLGLTWWVNYRFVRHVLSAPEITDPRIVQLSETARRELGIRRSLRMIESAQVHSPAIMGLFRSTLILPKDVRARFDDDELRFIFLHEFAHLKRGDLFLQWLVALLQILHWFNPALWYAFRRMRADREPATDALVLSCTGERYKEPYGQVLVKLLEHYHLRHSLPTLVGILEDKDQFKRRFTLIARFTRGAYGWSLLGFLLIAVLSVACLTKSKATETPDTPKPQVQPYLQVNYIETTDTSAHAGGLTIEAGYAKKLVQNPTNKVTKLANFPLAVGTNAFKFKTPSGLDCTVTILWNDLLTTKERGLTAKIETSNWSLEFKPPPLRPGECFLITGGNTQTPNNSHILISFADHSSSGGGSTVLPVKAAPPATQDASRKDIAAIVNGHAITQEDLKEACQSTENVLRANYLGQELNAKLIEARKNVLQTLFDRQLILDDFKAQGGSIQSSYIDDEIDDIVRGQYGGDRQAFLATLAEHGQTLGDYRTQMENNAIVGYLRNKFVEEKVQDYYQANLDLFPAEEQLRITPVEIKGSVPVPFGHTADFATETDPRAAMARDVLRKMRAGEDVSSLAPTEGIDPGLAGKTRWVTRARYPIWWPITWAQVEKLNPGETTGVAVSDGDFSSPGHPEQNYHYYYIIRLDERHPAKIPGTPDALNQEKALLDAERRRVQEDWLAPLRAKAKVQIFDAALTVDPWALPPTRSAPALPGRGAFEVPDAPTTSMNSASLEPAILPATAIETPTAYPSQLTPETPGKNTSHTTEPSAEAVPLNKTAEDLDTLKQDLLMAKENADARRVLVNSVKDLPDDQFLATLAGLGRSDPSITALQKDIADKNAEIAGLLNSGLTEDHPRVVAQRAQIAVKQKQLKDAIAGLRRAVAIDSQMADSRVTALNEEMAKAPSGTPVPVIDPLAKYNAGQELDDLKQNLQQAKEDSDARWVLVNSVKDLPDDQLLATLPGLGRSDPSITALQKEIADRNADIASLLNSGFSNDNPRVTSARAELALKQQQMKDLIAGVRRAMAIDQQMADSRVSLISKQVEAQVAKAQPDQATEPTAGSLTSTAAAKGRASANAPSIEIGMKVIEISNDDYLANKAKVDAAVEKAEIDFFNKMEGVSLLAAPIVTTLPGMKANIDIVRKYPYPIKFDPAMRVSNSGGATVTVPTTPTDFVTKDVGVSAEITPTINAADSPDPGKIVLNGKFSVTDFDGFTKSNVLGPAEMPSFTTIESLFLEALDDHQEKGLWIPGEHIALQNPTAANFVPAWETTAPMIKKRYLLFVNANLVK